MASSVDSTRKKWENGPKIVPQDHPLRQRTTFYMPVAIILLRWLGIKGYSIFNSFDSDFKVNFLRGSVYVVLTR